NAFESTYDVPETSPTETRTYGETTANGHLDAYQLLREAAQKAAHANVDVADSLRSTQPSPATGARLQQTGPLLSRAHAAHLLMAVQPRLDSASHTAWEGLIGFEPVRTVDHMGPMQWAAEL